MSYNKTIWKTKDIITRGRMQKIEDELERLSNLSRLNIYLCNNNEYDSETGIPTINMPNSETIYLTPNENDINNVYQEWIYVNNAWEKFGESTSAPVQIPIPSATDGSYILQANVLNGIPTYSWINLPSAEGVDF